MEPNPDNILDSLRLKILDLSVVHMYSFDDLMYVTYTIIDDYKSGPLSIGSVILPASKTKEMELQEGDILTILVQKSKSMYHQKPNKCSLEENCNQ